MRRRLGALGGRRAWFNFFIRPFAASSFAGFWRRWNPVYDYYLNYFCYRPLTKVMPRHAAILTTFMACGMLLNDLPAWVVARRVLPPRATIAFSLFGAGAVIGERVYIDLSRRPVVVWAALNSVYLAGSIGSMLLIVRGITRTRRTA